jgi:hypothetical protein
MGERRDEPSWAKEGIGSRLVDTASSWAGRDLTVMVRVLIVCDDWRATLARSLCAAPCDRGGVGWIVRERERSWGGTCQRQRVSGIDCAKGTSASAQAVSGKDERNGCLDERERGGSGWRTGGDQGVAPHLSQAPRRRLAESDRL